MSRLAKRVRYGAECATSGAALVAASCLFAAIVWALAVGPLLLALGVVGGVVAGHGWMADQDWLMHVAIWSYVAVALGYLGHETRTRDGGL